MIEIKREDLNRVQRNARPLDPHERAAAGDSEQDRKPLSSGESLLLIVCTGLSIWAVIALLIRLGRNAQIF